MRFRALGVIIILGTMGAAYAQMSPTDHDAAPGDASRADASARAVQPAHGANSFSVSQARRRIAAKGYAQVTDLVEDAEGVWRAQAVRRGQPVQVWLDYTGKVGQQP